MAPLLFALLEQVCSLSRFLSTCSTAFMFIFKLFLWCLLFCPSFVRVQQKHSGPLHCLPFKDSFKILLAFLNFTKFHKLKSIVHCLSFSSIFSPCFFSFLDIYLLTINNFLYIALVISCSSNHHINLCIMVIVMEMSV